MRLKFLSESEVYRLHSASLEILEQIGVQFKHEKVLELLEKSGAAVDHKQMIAKLPEELVMEAIRKVKKKFTIRSRDPRFNIEVGSGKLICSMGSQLYMIDLLTRERRLGTVDDIIKGCILGDALQHVSCVAPIVFPHEVPPEIREIVAYQVGVKHTSKPFGVYIIQETSVPYLLEMAATVAGGLDYLVKGNDPSCIASCVSPLRYSFETINVMKHFAELGLPITFNSMPQAGLTAPITLAGCIALGNAEVLSGMVLAYLIGGRVPVLYANAPHVADMRSGNISFGSPEQAILCVGAVQLANFYGFPANVNAGLTDSKTPDIQAGIEKATSTVLAILAGAEGVGAQGIVGADQGGSLEQLILDNELIDYMKTVGYGLPVDDETIATNVCKEVGVGGLFLTHPHTLARARRVLWEPKIFDRLRWDEWINKGHKDALVKAKDTVALILKEHRPQPLERDVEKEIDAIVERARKELLKSVTQP